MFNELKKLIPLNNPLRLFYHKIRAIVANIANGFPSKEMTIIWVTWTNWKTTTCNIIAKWLKEAGEKVFMFSTVNIIMWDEEYTNNSKMTSPDAFELQKLLKIAKSKWIKIAIIETASHWIKMHRIWGINYDIVALTNITQDHLDLHKTMDDYVNTKLEIFKNLIIYKRKLWVKKTAIVNTDSKYHNLFTSETYDSLLTYWKNIDANLSIKNNTETKDGSKFEIKIWNEFVEIKTKLRWDFNSYNLTAAIGIFMSMWIPLKKIQKIVQNIPTIAWRLEEVENVEWYKIFVDYAHTADALENIIETLNNIKWDSNIITVFWATWDRDKTKRPVMWEVVSRLSDIVILTQDDDYSEKTEDIIKDVLPWIERKEWENFWVITNREDAIRTALIWAKKGDIILVAWKWDEHKMITNSWAKKWHDKTKIKEILKSIDDNKLVL